MLNLSVVLLLTACSYGCAIRGENMKEGEPPRRPQQARLYPITVDDKHGFIDESGNVKFMLPEEVYTIFAFSEGLAVAGKRVPNTNGRWGFIDETGKYVIEAKFVMVKPFSEGLAAVVFKDNENAYRSVGYIDQSGRMVIPPQFSGEGNVSGQWIAKPQYESAGEFSEGLAPVLMNRKVGFIDLRGEMAIKPQFDPDGTGGCVLNGRVGASRFSEGLAAVQLRREVWGKEWGFIDPHGNWVIQPEFACAAPFSEGLALIGIREVQGAWRYGYIDKTGAIVIKPQFSEAFSFAGKLALVTIGMTEEEVLAKASEAGKPEAEIEKELEKFKKKYAYIDRTGKVVWQTPH